MPWHHEGNSKPPISARRTHQTFCFCIWLLVICGKRSTQAWISEPGREASAIEARMGRDAAGGSMHRPDGGMPGRLH